jgi:pimeloyl-ACP methyl ester carboxylesterase
MPTLQRDGFDLHYDVAGDGPPLLLTHGFGASSATFAANVASLAASHRVVTWDVRGHGQSASPDDPSAYSVDLALEDIAALLDLVADGSPVVLGGHSLGGYLSMRFTVLHPGRVAALVLLDTGPGYGSDEGRAKWNRLIEKLAMRTSNPGRAHAARGILMQHDALVIESLASIEVPVLIVVGADDNDFRAGSSVMASRMPDARLVVVDGAGHEPHETHADVVDSEILAFLGTSRPEARA